MLTDEIVECELSQYHMQCVQKQVFSTNLHHQEQFFEHLNQVLGKPAKHKVNNKSIVVAKVIPTLTSSSLVVWYTQLTKSLR